MLSRVFGFEKNLNSGSLRFIVIDGSTVQELGAKGTTYRLHVATDLVNLTFHQVELTTDKQGEHLDHYCIGEGDVVLLDRGYNQPKTLVSFIDRGGDVILRYNAHSMNLFTRDEEMEKIDWQAKLQQLHEKPAGKPGNEPRRKGEQPVKKPYISVAGYSFSLLCHKPFLTRQRPPISTV